MIETIGKNIWLLLTVILPGLFTYGAWRLLLVLYPSHILDSEAFTAIDNSGIITTSIIISIAILQQAVGISIEFIMSMIAKITQKYSKSFYSLFWERFELTSAGLLNEKSSRTIGKLFLSINIFAGLLLLLFYFKFYESLNFDHWILKFLVFFLIFNLTTIIFRMYNALSVIKKCNNDNKNNMKTHPNA